jgi:hypothetical protein
MLLAAQAATPAPASEEEIVVIAQKMRLIKVDMDVRKHDGALALRRCRVTRGSGRKELDEIPCSEARTCVAEGVASRKALIGCVEARSNIRVDAIIAGWRARS